MWPPPPPTERERVVEVTLKDESAATDKLRLGGSQEESFHGIMAGLVTHSSWLVRKGIADGGHIVPSEESSLRKK